jgi:uncharacterized protein
VGERAELLRRAYEAFNARDVETLRELIDPEIEFGTTVEAVRGFDAVVAWEGELRQTFDDYRAEPTDILEAGDLVIVDVHQTGTGKGSGVEVEHFFTHVWTVRDGRVVALRAFSDHRDALAFAGLEAPGD